MTLHCDPVIYIENNFAIDKTYSIIDGIISSSYSVMYSHSS